MNSSYSFWWDITNDWGLTLLKGETWSKDTRNLATNSYHPIPQGSASNSRSSSSGSSGSQIATTFAKAHTRKQSSFSALPLSSLPSTPMADVRMIQTTNAGPHPFGLRSPLLFRDSVVYYLVILLNFVLRFTWSLKLSSHLHSVAELESGVFLMEALELIRRWMWVFFRVEWEVVKKMQERDIAQLSLMKSVGPGLANGAIHESIELFSFPEDNEMAEHVNGEPLA